MAKRRKPALVSQYLEGISRAALDEYQQLFKEFARRRHGVYALYRGKRLHYVGLARDLRNRLNQHLKGKHGESWDRFSMYLTIGDEHIRELESLVLRIVRPKGNVQVGRFGRAENLRRAFARRVREDSRTRLDELLGRTLPALVDRTQPKSKQRVAVLARYIKGRAMRIRGRHKGRIVRARVLKNGVIRVRGKRFTSPSLAAVAACPPRRAMNGWAFWLYERAPGDWVRLSELRR
jgi:hypothetical protein